MASFRDPPFLDHLPEEIAASETTIDSVGIVLDRIFGWRHFFWIGVFRIVGSRLERVDFRGPLPSGPGEPRAPNEIRNGFAETKAMHDVTIHGPGKKMIGVLHVETDETCGFSLEDKRILALLGKMLGSVLSRPDRPERVRYDL